MTQSKQFAPSLGPWTCGEQCDGAIDIFDDRGVRIACVESVGVTDRVAQANAYLMTSAPELLAALKHASITLANLIDSVERTLPIDHTARRAVTKATQAIAKAEPRITH